MKVKRLPPIMDKNTKNVGAGFMSALIVFIIRPAKEMLKINNGELEEYVSQIHRKI
jgi:hypothetical protein